MTQWSPTDSTAATIPGCSAVEGTARRSGRIARRSALAAGVSLLAAPILARAAIATGAAIVDDTQCDAFTALGTYTEFGTFLGVLEQSGLAGQIRSSQNFTLLAPTNAALYKYPNYLQTLIPGGSQMFPSMAKLIEYVRDHVIAGIYMPGQFSGKHLSVTSLSGVSIEIHGTGSGTPAVIYHLPAGMAVTAALTEQPIGANNAIIYPINDAILR